MCCRVEERKKRKVRWWQLYWCEEEGASGRCTTEAVMDEVARMRQVAMRRGLEVRVYGGGAAKVLESGREVLVSDVGVVGGGGGRWNDKEIEKGNERREALAVWVEALGGG